MSEELPRRGKLKIYLGYADGVGKSFAMLESALQRKEEGLDVAVGWVEAHRQPDTLVRLAKLEVIPPAVMESASGSREEMDLEAILARKPALALIDHLAHVNAPGMRHPQRYQDVEDLLASGIDVYTTLNIQNLESLRDVVHQITGLAVSETIPDMLFDETNIIELIDLPPDELLQRFYAGKIYVSAAEAQQASQFYRLGNLIALRELCLRRVAGRIESQMTAYMVDRAVSGPWKASERLMVCVSSHLLSERLVRTGQQLAKALDAAWYAVYVETPERLRFSPQHQDRVNQTLQLAEQLGATVVKISGRTIPDTLLNFARRQNITRIIIGNLLRPRWMELFSSSVAEQVIRRSGNVDVTVVTEEGAAPAKLMAAAWRPHGNWIRYVYSLLIVAAATLLGFPLVNILHPANLVMLYLAAVVISAIYFGRGPSMLASLLGVLSFDFFFVHPQFSLTISDTQYLLTFFGLLAVGLVISYLTGLVGDQVEALQRRQAQTATLYNLSRELTVLVDLPAILNAVIQQIVQTFSRESVILLPTNGQLEVRAASAGLKLEESEWAAAAWAYENGRPAGRGTQTFPDADVRCQPLRTPRGMTGVLCVRPLDMSSRLSQEQEQFLDAYAGLAALAIERANLAEEASQAQVNANTEKLQTALLNSISHDLRTPLATITGVFSSLHETEGSGSDQVKIDPADRLELIDTGWEEARRLNRLVGNLLDITRLEAGALRLNRRSADVQDVVGAALGRLADPQGHGLPRSRLAQHPLVTGDLSGLPPVNIDFVLIEQALVNLLENAAKYSPPGTPIEIEGSLEGSLVKITVLDLGSGFPSEDLEKVFEKFYRAQRNGSPGGTGLGLSICRGIVEAHGGRIWAENRPGGGAVVAFTLPVEENPV